MKEETKQKRRLEIEQAAYGLLAEFGFEGTSMLSIAKKANASNQTLYRWYGDKVGLFRQMVETNAQDIEKKLEEALASETGMQGTLQEIGPLLLGMLLGDRAIMLNRAAASDKSFRLGKVISQSGREQIFPLIQRLVSQAMKNSEVSFPSPQAGATLYINLLIGDLQIRRVIGAMQKPSEKEIAERAQAAFDAFLYLGNK